MEKRRKTEPLHLLSLTVLESGGDPEEILRPRTSVRTTTFCGLRFRDPLRFVNSKTCCDSATLSSFQPPPHPTGIPATLETPLPLQDIEATPSIEHQSRAIRAEALRHNQHQVSSTPTSDSPPKVAHNQDGGTQTLFVVVVSHWLDGRRVPTKPTGPGGRTPGHT